MKKIAVIFIIIAVLFSFCVPSFGYEPVNSFWSANTKYAQALNSKDYNNIIKYGLETMSLIEQDIKNEETALEWYEARGENVGYAYERLGMYDSSANMYEKVLPFAKKRNMTDSVKVMSAKIMHFRSDISLFKKTNVPVINYGAINEPKMGTYYGITSDSTTSLNNASATILYIPFGNYNDIGWINKVLSNAEKNKTVVEIALNVESEGVNFSENIINNMGYMDYLIDILDDYDVKYFVRFGAEFDIWGNSVSADDYKTAFRNVANIVHHKLKNTAMVFSPNMVSSWNLDVNDYYPGDEYVDWVGVSMYMNKYFLGTKNADDDKQAKDNEAVFGAGDYANPVLCLKKIVDLYGDRKPIMLSESGASHTIRTYSENATPFASNRLQEMYEYLPMVYPQVKLIIHFDKVIQDEINDYSLSQNAEIESLYKKLTSNSKFIQSGSDVAKETYERLDNVISVLGNSLDLYAYVNVFKDENCSVNYYIDGNWQATSKQIPYNINLDFSAFDFGTHNLKVEVINSNGENVINKNYDIIIAPAVNLNGKIMQFDVLPEVINERTMVPMRFIFEALGANVDWDEATQTATGIKNNVKVSITVGSNIISVNGSSVEIDSPALVKNDRTLVPLRVIAQSFDCDVIWNESEKTAYITSK